MRNLRKVVLIIGAAGSGKGTISKKIVDKFGFVHLSTGDILRESIQSNTDLGGKAQQYMNKGELVPDHLIVDILKDNVDDRGKGKLLLDGFPRTVGQANLLTSLLPVQQVIILNVPHEEILRRLSQRWIHPGSQRVYNMEYSPPQVHGKDDITGEALTQREDDTPAFIQKRLDDYEEKTKPLVDYYKQDSAVAVTRFTGNNSDEIFAEIDKSLSEMLSS